MAETSLIHAQATAQVAYQWHSNVCSASQTDSKAWLLQTGYFSWGQSSLRIGSSLSLLMLRMLFSSNTYAVLYTWNRTCSPCHRLYSALVFLKFLCINSLHALNLSLAFAFCTATVARLKSSLHSSAVSM